VLRFTSKEFEVLHILASANGRVVTQRQLIELVWGSANADSVQYLRVFIGRLRAKIEDDPANPKILVTERGVGYRLVPGGPVHSE
jgi:two-component system KDP operon response regulator KdpE